VGIWSPTAAMLQENRKIYREKLERTDAGGVVVML
jgi:hypothetical protein